MIDNAARSVARVFASFIVFSLFGTVESAAQDGTQAKAVVDRVGAELAAVHKQLRPYDRTLQMRVARGAVTAQEVLGLLKRRANELANGQVTASALVAEEQQEANTYFQFIVQMAASSTRWPAAETPAYHRAYVQSIVERARKDYATPGRAPEIALSSAYRALALARGEPVQVITPFDHSHRRITAAFNLPPPKAMRPPAAASPAAVSPAAAPAAPQRGQMLGCYRDTNAPFDLDGFLERSNQNTPERCIALCASKQFRFAGVQYGQSCLCGNSYGRYGSATNCNMACTGSPSQICGGINSNNVYRTGL
jgi:hypothetical protein